MLGTDGMMFPIRALDNHTEISLRNTTYEELSKRRRLEETGLSLYHRSSEDVTINESEQWQYHIYKIINNKEELVYIPILSWRY